MFLVKKLISAWILSPAGLGVLIIVGLAAVAAGKKRLGLIVTGLTAFMLVALSLPWVSDGLMRAAETTSARPERLEEVQAIVILGGGIHRGAPEYEAADTLSPATLVRVRYGAWLAKRNHLPVLVSGGSVLGGTAEAKLMASTLEMEFGVPVRWIESASKDTGENAVFSSRILQQNGISRIGLVSHAYHLRRASALFTKQGMTVVPAPTFSTVVTTGLEAWLPSASSLDNSFVAIHETAGRLVDAVR